eukprot:11155790-Alexandrium_andersonii.AAC.1
MVPGPAQTINAEVLDFCRRSRSRPRRPGEARAGSSWPSSSKRAAGSRWSSCTRWAARRLPRG